jgi:hypothetical protein
VAQRKTRTLFKALQNRKIKGSNIIPAGTPLAENREFVDLGCANATNGVINEIN